MGRLLVRNRTNTNGEVAAPSRRTLNLRCHGRGIRPVVGASAGSRRSLGSRYGPPRPCARGPRPAGGFGWAVADVWRRPRATGGSPLCRVSRRKPPPLARKLRQDLRVHSPSPVTSANCMSHDACCLRQLALLSGRSDSSHIWSVSDAAMHLAVRLLSVGLGATEEILLAWRGAVDWPTTGIGF